MKNPLFITKLKKLKPKTLKLNTKFTYPDIAVTHKKKFMR